MKGKKGMRMWMGWGLLLSLIWVGCLGAQETTPKQTGLRPQLKVAVLEKAPRGQSACQLGLFYPALTENLREALRNDGRFDLIPERKAALTLMHAGIAQDKIDPKDALQLTSIGELLGADVVLSSTYYEMSCHGMSMRSQNTLSLAKVRSKEVRTIQKAYPDGLSLRDLAFSDASALQELLALSEAWLFGP